jgi:hypothetical protein
VPTVVDAEASSVTIVTNTDEATASVTKLENRLEAWPLEKT